MTPHTFHQSLIRPNLLLGCDRDLILFSGLMAFILIAMSQSWTAAFIGSFIWFSAFRLSFTPSCFAICAVSVSIISFA